MQILIYLDQAHLIANGVEPQTSIRVPVDLTTLTPAQRRKLANHTNPNGLVLATPNGGRAIELKVQAVSADWALAALLEFLDRPTNPADMDALLRTHTTQIAREMAAVSLPVWSTRHKLADGRLC